MNLIKVVFITTTTTIIITIIAAASAILDAGSPGLLECSCLQRY